MSEKKKQTFLDGIWSSIIWTSLDRLAALFKHAYIASILGLTPEVDVFYITVSILTISLFSWGKIFEIIALPRLVDIISQGKTIEAAQFSSDLFGFSVICSLALGVLLNFSWPIVIKIMPGFDPDRAALLSDSIRWIQPILFLYIPTRMLYSIVKANRAFYLAYRNECILTFSILIVIATQPHSDGVLLWSFSIGVFIAFITTASSSRQFLTQKIKPFSKEILKLLPSSIPLLMLFSTQHLYSIIDKGFLSFFPQGYISVIAYAWTLTMLAPSVIQLDGAFITIYTEAKRDSSLRTESVNNLISASITIGVMLSLLLIGFGEDIVAILLERGKFGPEDTVLVSNCLSIFSPSIIPLLLLNPLGQIFQVEHRIKLIIRRFILGISANVICCYLFIFELDLGLNGAALATTISQWLMVLTALFLLQQIELHVNYRRHFLWLLSLLLLGLLDLEVAETLRSMHPSHWMMAPSGLLFLLLFALPVILGRSRESALANELLLRSLRKFSPRKKR